MSQSPKQPTTINDLCDDILRDIFGYLNASELYVVAQVCQAFNRNAQAELPSRFKVVKFGNDDRPKYYNLAENRFTFRRAAPVLQKFGASIVSFEVMHRGFSAELMYLLIEYCGKSQSLKELRLPCIRFTSDMVLKLRPILSRLEVLRLTCCEWEHRTLATEFLSHCSELHTIELAGLQKMFIANRISFPKLTSLSFGDCEDLTENGSIERLLASTPLLKEINISGNIEIIFRSIFAHNLQIEKIKMYFFEGAQQLKRLTKLKSLDIDCNGESFTPVLKELAAARVPLEYLRLYNFRTSAEFLNEISKWKQLKRLELAYEDELLIDEDGDVLEYVSWADVLTIVRNLSELTELSLCIPDATINDLVEIVRCAPKLRKLEWDLHHWDEIDEHVLDVDSFLKIRDVLAKRKEKSPALLISVFYPIQINLPDEFRKANEDLLKIQIQLLD